MSDYDSMFLSYAARVTRKFWKDKLRLHFVIVEDICVFSLALIPKKISLIDGVDNV